MLRRLLRLAWAAASVVALWLCVALCVAAPAAWVDSHWRETAVQHRTRAVAVGRMDERTYRLMSHGGQVGLLVQQFRVRGPIVLLFLFEDPPKDTTAPSEWRVERFRWNSTRDLLPIHVAESFEWVERGGLGFVYIRATGTLMRDERRLAVHDTARYWAVPYWAVLAAALPLPLWRLQKWYRRRRRVRAGLCSRCGYDLRATPGRCPECGAGTSSPWRPKGRGFAVEPATDAAPPAIDPPPRHPSNLPPPC